MQYGSREGRQCISAVINKQLTHDIIRHQKLTAAFIENDAVGCYDRMTNNLLLLELQRLGLPPLAAQTVSKTWLQAVHHIRTKYGISATTYANSLERMLFGPGQGSTIGPFLWLLLFTLIVTSLLPTTPQTNLASVNGAISVSDVGEAFVDDSRVGCTSSHEYDSSKSLSENASTSRESAIRNLHILAQQWEKLLFATGGAISLDKSFWYCLSWKWSPAGIPHLSSNEQAPGRLQLTAGYNTDTSVIRRMEVTDGYRTLGVQISPSGSNKLAISTLATQSHEFAGKIASSTLNRESTYWAYWQYYIPKLGYSLPALTLTREECEKIQSPAICATLSKLHFNRNTSRAVVFGPVKYAGINLPHLYTTQSIGQLRSLLGHLCLRDKLANLFLIDISTIQLLVGSYTLFFNLPYPSYHVLVEPSWLTSVWCLLDNLNYTVAIRQAYVPIPPRRHDSALMDQFIKLGLPKADLQRLNRCRTYLQIFHLSDITSADGTSIMPCYKDGHRCPFCSSTLSWPIQPRPPRPTGSCGKGHSTSLK